jgi:Zn finger protein HypA/HybF involved in hydrogenase expression
VEQEPPVAERALVRCLDCDTVYELPLEQEEAEPCPECGGVGWVALDAGRGREHEIDS